MNKRPPTLQIFQQNKKLKQAIVCEPPMTQGPNPTQGYNPTQSYYPQQHTSYQQHNYDHTGPQHNNHQAGMSSNQAGMSSNQSGMSSNQAGMASHITPQLTNSLPSHQPNNFYSQAIQQSQAPGNQFNQYNVSHNNNMNQGYNPNSGQNNQYNGSSNQGNTNQFNAAKANPSNQYNSNLNHQQGTAPNYNPNLAPVQYNPPSYPMTNTTYNAAGPNSNQPRNAHHDPNMQGSNGMPPSNQSYPSYPNQQTPTNQPSYGAYNKQPPTNNINAGMPSNNFGYNSPYPSTKYQATTATSLITNRPVETKVEKSVTQPAKPVKRGARTLSCTISSLLHWSKYSAQCPMLFELYACVDSVEESSGLCRKFIVTDSQGGRLQCVYYDMVAIPPILHAKHYRLLGKMTGEGKLQCVKVTQVNFNSSNPDLIKQSNVSMSKFVLQLNEH